MSAYRDENTNLEDNFKYVVLSLNPYYRGIVRLLDQGNDPEETIMKLWKWKTFYQYDRYSREMEKFEIFKKTDYLEYLKKEDFDALSSKALKYYAGDEKFYLYEN